MSGPGRRTVWLVVLATVGMAAGAAATSPGHVEGVLETPHQVTLDGQVDAGADRGALNVLADDLDVHLSATAIEVRAIYEEGYATEDPQGSTVSQTYTEVDREWVNLTGVELSVQPLAPGAREPQVLAMAETGTARLETTGQGTATAAVVEDKRVATHWRNWTSVNTPETGFVYEVQGPWTGLSGADLGVVEGNFTLFVNNVTIDATGDQGSWSQWAGVKEEPPSSPAGPLDPSPARSYEVHTLVIDVTGGTLTAEAPGEVELYGPSLDGDLSATTITAESVSGQLTSDASVLRFDQAPLEAQGSGVLHLGVVPAGGELRGSVAWDGEPRLSLAPRGEFQVETGEGVEVHALSEQGTIASALLPSGPWLGVIATLTGLVLVVGAVAVSAPVKAHAWWDQRVARWRADRYDRWIQRANEHEHLHDFARAARWWRKIVDAYPERRHGWFRLALAHLETGDHEAVLSVLHEARQRFGRLPSDFYEVWMSAAWALDRKDEALAALKRWANASPTAARRRLEEDPTYRPLLEDEEVRRMLQIGDLPDDADRSYA